MKTRLLLLCAMILPLSSFGQWKTLDYLSTPRVQFTIVKMGDEILFVGGNNSAAGLTDVIEVYNPITRKWPDPLWLSSKRCFPIAVVGDSALYVAGGLTSFSTVPYGGTNAVDVYKNGVRSTVYLDQSFFAGGAVKVGDYVMFAAMIHEYEPSTNVTSVLDSIYLFNEVSGVWSKAALSLKRSAAAVISDGQRAFIAGGQLADGNTTNRVDIFDAATQSWSIDSLSQARTDVAGIFHKGKFYFAGGAISGANNPSDVVDIYDGSQWTTAKLSSPRAGIKPCATNDLVFFTGGGNLNLDAWQFTTSSFTADVFNTLTNKWTTSVMNSDKINHASVSGDNVAYVAGGLSFDQGFAVTEEIEQWSVALGTGTPMELLDVQVFPNPANDVILLKTADQHLVISADIFNSIGNLVMHVDYPDSVLDISHMVPGTYHIQVLTDMGSTTLLLVKR